MSSVCSANIARPAGRAGVNPAVRPSTAPSPQAPPLRSDTKNRVHKFRDATVAYAAQQAQAPEAAAISEEELIQLTKEFEAAGFGAFADRLSEDFIFRGPVIGPLPKSLFVEMTAGFKVPDAFPDIKTEAFGFSIDPEDPYRVWFFSRTTGTHTADFTFGDLTIPPTGGKIQNGVEVASVIWTPDRKVKYLSAGYCVDRINSSTPNGTMKVAVAGFLRAAGKGEVWDIAISPAAAAINNFIRKLQGKPTVEVDYEALPAWWKALPDGKLKGPENYHK